MAAPVLSPVTSLCISDPTLLYNLGHAALEAIASELLLAAPYVPADVINYRFVSFNEPAWDCCPALSVYVSNLRPTPDDLARLREGRMCCPSTYMVDLTFVILQCYATQDPQAGISADILNSEAQAINAIGMAAWAGFICQWRAGNIVESPNGDCLLAWLSPLDPIGPESGCAGWRFTATILLECP